MEIVRHALFCELIVYRSDGERNDMYVEVENRLLASLDRTWRWRGNSLTRQLIIIDTQNQT